MTENSAKTQADDKTQPAVTGGSPTDSSTTKPAAGSDTGQIQESKTPDKPSLLNEPAKEEPKAAAGAPEKYEDFKLPEGFELDADRAGEATAVFKELGLPQEGAQRLIDLYSKNIQEAIDAPFKLWNETQERWVNEVKADPEIGGKLDLVRQTISKAVDGLGDPNLANAFRSAMDATGAGNNPAFIRAFYKMAQRLTEGTHVSGQPAKSSSTPPSAAKALFPDLP